MTSDGRKLRTKEILDKQGAEEIGIAILHLIICLHVAEQESTLL